MTVQEAAMVNRARRILVGLIERFEREAGTGLPGAKRSQGLCWAMMDDAKQALDSLPHPLLGIACSVTESDGEERHG